MVKAMLEDEYNTHEYIKGIGLDTKPEIVEWLKINTPTYRVLYGPTGFHKQVWFTTADDYILFKLTFDITA